MVRPLFRARGETTTVVSPLVRRLGRRGQTRLMIIASALALLPLVTLAALSVQMSGSAVRSEVDRNVRTSALVSARYIDEQLQGLADVVNSYARRPVLIRALEDGIAGPADVELIRSQLAELRTARPGLAVTFLSDERGILLDIDPATPAIVGMDFSFRDWFKGVTGLDRPYVSEVYQSAAAGAPVVAAAAAPVRRADDSRMAILVAAYSTEAIQQFADDFARAQGVRLTVWDQRDALVARAADAPPTLTGVRPLLAAAHRGEVKVTDLGEGGKQVIAAAATGSRSGWSVVAEVSTREAMAGARRLRTTVLLVATLLGLILAGGLLLLLGLLRERKRTQEHLAAAHLEAMEASRLKSEFVANMSHEIRTPLNGVIGMTELLLGTPLTDRQREYAETARWSGDALLSVVNDILDFSKIEAGKLDLETVEVDLRAVVEEAASILAPTAHAKGLELTTNVRADVPETLVGDPGRLRQVVVNLVSNAVKFTDEGEVSVAVEVVGEMAESATLRLVVSDTGPGIEDSQRRRLFESFTQLEGSTTRTHGGTGLGLAISKQLIEMMGGEIGVESEPGRGSNFWFTVTLPCRRAALRARSSALEGMPVLVVDDNATNRTILDESLRRWGMEPTAVASGDEALRALDAAVSQGKPYPLVLLDFMMPAMDGLELARKIREKVRPLPRLVLLTSAGTTGDIGSTHEAGISAYLTKPVRQSALYDRLAELVAGGPGTSPPLEREVESDTAVGDPTTVLIVEDNEVNQRVARAMLESLGVDADVASDGSEAVRMAAETPYAAILMDCQMPVMDGFEATMAIRAREQDSRVPILAMTAGALEGDQEKCLAAGMDVYLTKPITRAKLAEALSAWIVTIPRASGPDAGSSELDVLDAGMISELRSLGVEGVGRIVSVYIESAWTRIEEARAAVDGADHATLAATAHALKGSSANFGAARVASACSRLEACAREADTVAAQGIVEELRHELTNAERALRAAFPVV